MIKHNLLYIAGLGCRRGCPEADLYDLLAQTLRVHGLQPADLSGLASIEQKRDEPGLLALAQHLDLPLTLFSPDQLSPFAERVTQLSVAALHSTGSASVAEACALAQVEALTGATASLLISRHSSAQATFALAGVMAIADDFIDKQERA
ncbi:cobalamin biosynthesis protein [Aquipseudomonas ullengensis]|uniref:cobalamin biosynthesis protein n=1 Tax=Aquipseudomonas ullengensis TaxID=2759166 RepID=UPI002E2B9703|nr:cobalamin biosynthesis protein [Pseudomonas ullengensis]